MIGVNTSQEFRTKSIDKIRNYFLEETEQNELMSKHFLILASIITWCISISAFPSCLVFL